MNWHFRPLAPGEPTRDPIIGEFFSTVAIRQLMAPPAEPPRKEIGFHIKEDGVPYRIKRTPVGKNAA